jgi:hypothetical protein
MMAQLKTFALNKRQAKLNSFKAHSDFDRWAFSGRVDRMESTSPMTALNRMLDPLSDCLNAEAARRIVALRIAPDIQARIEELAERCNEGQLTEAERVEYDGYVEGAEIVSLIKL